MENHGYTQADNHTHDVKKRKEKEVTNGYLQHNSVSELTVGKLNYIIYTY